MHPVVSVRQRTRRRVEGGEESGFTLVELLLVVVILPLVLGGITAALLAVFGLQNQTQNRITDSNDAALGSATFNKDVQSSEQVTSAGFAVCSRLRQSNGRPKRGPDTGTRPGMGPQQRGDRRIPDGRLLCHGAAPRRERGRSGAPGV